MMNFICNIPEHIGWTIVGALGIVCAIMLWKVGKLIYIAVKERLEDESEE